MSSDANALGTPAELVAAIQKASRAGQSYDSRPGSGIRLSGDLPSVENLDTSFVPRGVLAQFVYLPDFQKPGPTNLGPAGPTAGYRAGTINRHILSQRLIGWTDRGDAFVQPTYSTQPKDGYSGTLIGITAPGGDQANPTFNGVPASDAK